MAGLQRRSRRPRCKEVRGRGLMIAVELHPDAGGARPVCEALRARGLLCKETHDHTIRIAPPLILTGAGRLDRRAVPGGPALRRAAILSASRQIHRQFRALIFARCSKLRAA